MIALLLSLFLSFHSQAFEIPRESAIFGGQPVAASMPAWKSTVTLWMGGSRCTGVVIAPDLILTAAHCPGVGAKEILVGFYRENNPEVEFLQLSGAETFQFIAHPGYRLSQGRKVGADDLAFLLLKKAALPQGFLPAAIRPTPVRVGEPTLHVGSGVINETTKADRLNYAIGTITALMPEGMLAIEAAPSQGICSGDSGGPVFTSASDGRFMVTALATAVIPNLNKNCGGMVFVTGLTPERIQWVQATANQIRRAN